ncbi:MAG: ATP-binding protein, partial [Methanomicrobiales archaeon]|nr:ATP-binding protein [Methanomicrobiales archaeon]
ILSGYGNSIYSLRCTLPALAMGITIIFQNIYYIPIILASYYYQKKGILLSSGLLIFYLASIMSFTQEMGVLLQALARAPIFLFVSMIVAYLSILSSRERQRLSVTNEILAVVASSIDQNELLERFLKRTMELLEFDAGALIVLDTKAREPRSYVHRGFSASEEELRRNLCVDNPLLKEAVTSRRTLFRKEGNLPQGFFRDFHYLAVYPIMSQFTLVGVLMLARRRHREAVENEYETLESITTIIGGTLLKGMIQEELVQTRLQREEIMEELRWAHEEANLYIDIMTHDINNANMAALGFGQFLIESLKNQEKEMAGKMLIAVQQSVEIIKNVSTIRKLREGREPLRPISLGEVVRTQMNHFPGARISYEGPDVSVMADDLVGEVFTNLIGNSLKFGGPDTEIGISVKVENGQVEVTVTDDGPGIADDLKPEIFNRFRKGKSKKSGKGLGLFISRMLIERYGGSIWAEDRVKGAPGKGAAIKFTLQKAAG